MNLEYRAVDTTATHVSTVDGVPEISTLVCIDLMQLTSSLHVNKHKTDGGWKF